MASSTTDIDAMPLPAQHLAYHRHFRTFLTPRTQTLIPYHIPAPTFGILPREIRYMPRTHDGMYGYQRTGDAMQFVT